MNTKIFTIALLFCFISAASFAQKYNQRYNDRPYTNSLKIGTQIPFQHSLIYNYHVTQGFSVNGGLGLLTSPYSNIVLNGLENRGSISTNDRKIIDRTFRVGLSYQIGANFHFNKNYVRAFGQLVSLKGDLAITDLANLYLKTKILLMQFIDPIDVSSNVTMAGILFGRRFTFANPQHEIHMEASLSRTLGHNTNYKTGTFVDNMEIVKDVVYSEVNKDLNQFYNRYSWIPSLNIYYVYKF